MSKKTSEILIVDDKPANLQLLTELFKNNGYNVKGAPGGNWAINALKNYKPDLILLDIMMPDINGFELCKILKADEKTKEIPIIFISALSSPDEKTKAFSIGGVDYITKPFDNKELLARVKTHLLIDSLRNDLLEKNAQLEQEIKEKKEYEGQLLQQSKTAAMGEMMGVITHQWKHPISAISLYSQSVKEILAEEGCNEEALLDIQKNILEQVEHINITINDFRDFFKPSDNVQHFKACELTIDTYRLVEAKMKKESIKLVTAKHEHFDTFGYPNELKHVILNIFNNAYDAFKSSTVREKTIELNFQHNGDHGVIKIKDNAGGIPQDLLPDKIFENYISTKAKNGTGIGMHIAKVIVENKLGGQISAKNIEDGAEFTITLPISIDK